MSSKSAKSEPFTDVTFKNDYPGHSVADHEIFMAFNGDDQAVAFHEWWHEKGAVLFAAWLQEKKADAPARFNPRFDLKQAYPGVEPRHFDPEQVLRQGQEVAAQAASEDWKS